MSPLFLLALPPLAATALAVACCILAGRRERAFEDPTLDEDRYQPSLRLTPASAEPASIQARLAPRPGRTES